jgi:general secretion pathway protein N
MIEVPRHLPRYVLLAVLFYLVFLLVALPATWFSRMTTALSRGTVSVSEPRGTVWNGSGDLAIAPRRASHHLGQISWQIQPLWLLIGQLKLDMSVSGVDVNTKARLGIGLTGARIENLDAVFPASIAGQFHAAAGFTQPTGQLRVQSSMFEVRRGALRGELSLSWDGAGSQFFKLERIGDYRLDIKGHGATADLALVTAQGDLQLTGQGQWRADNGGVLRLQGSALAVGRQAELEPLLQLIGTQAANGRREYSLNLPLPLL